MDLKATWHVLKLNLQLIQFISADFNFFFGRSWNLKLPTLEIFEWRRMKKLKFQEISSNFPNFPFFDLPRISLFSKFEDDWKLFSLKKVWNFFLLRNEKFHCSSMMLNCWAWKVLKFAVLLVSNMENGERTKKLEENS